MKKIFAVFALALMTIAAHAQTGKNAAEARRIFDEMRATYSRLETFSHGHSILEVDGKKTIFGNQFAFRAPNLFLEVRHQPEGDQIGVSNGRTYYRYDPAYSKVPYLALPMPPAKLGRIGIVQYTGVGNDLALFLAGVDSFAPPWGRAKAALGYSLGQPTKINGVMTDAVVVRLDRADKAVNTYFIGQKDRLIYRIATTRQDGKKFSRYSMTYLNVRANPQIPLATFVFTPPPYARRTKLEEFYNEQKFVSKDVRVGEFPPPLSGTDLNGNAIDLKNYKGKVVLLDFWATWCSPCVVELPFVQAVYDKFHDQGLEIIGISLDGKREVLEKFVHEKDVTWPQIFGREQKAAKSDKRYNVRAIPFTVLIGRDGKIAAFNPRRLLLEPAIEKALAAPLPE